VILERSRLVCCGRSVWSPTVCLFPFVWTPHMLIKHQSHVVIGPKSRYGLMFFKPPFRLPKLLHNITYSPLYIESCIGAHCPGIESIPGAVRVLFLSKATDHHTLCLSIIEFSAIGLEVLFCRPSSTDSCVMSTSLNTEKVKTRVP